MGSATTFNHAWIIRTWPQAPTRVGHRPRMFGEGEVDGAGAPTLTSLSCGCGSRARTRMGRRRTAPCRCDGGVRAEALCPQEQGSGGAIERIQHGQRGCASRVFPHDDDADELLPIRVARHRDDDELGVERANLLDADQPYIE